MCGIRTYTPISYKHCIDCSALYLVTSRNFKRALRCKDCKRVYKRQQDRERKRLKSKDPKWSEIYKQRDAKNNYRLKWEKQQGRTSSINYNHCDNCRALHLVHEKRNDKYKDHYCDNCYKLAKPIRIGYRNCMKCGVLVVGRLVGFNRRKYCRCCAKEITKKNEEAKRKTEAYKERMKAKRKTEAYKERRRIYKRNTGLSNHRRRARYYGVYYEPVNRSKVFKRDKMCCQVCGIKCNKKQNDSAQATLGHIIPLARGGPHTYTNVRTECRACNVSRGVDYSNEQLTIFTDAMRS